MSVTSSCRDLSKLDPKVRQLCEQLIAEAAKQGLKVLITETYRSQERQTYLYEQGRKRPGQIVTNVKEVGYHGYGLAFDFCQNIKGKEYDDAFMKKVGKIGEKLGLEWGGSWTGFKDMPHFQYTYGLSLAQLRAGKRPPQTATVNNIHKATVGTVEINVCGEILKAETVLIQGNNYIRLRGLEGRHLTVGYVNGLATLDIRSKVLDTPIKQSTSNLVGKSYSVEIKKTQVRVQGEVLEAETVLIEGNNFIKLRGIQGKALTVGYVDGRPSVSKR